MRHQQQQQQQQQLGMMRGRRDVSAATNRIRLHHGTRAGARRRRASRIDDEMAFFGAPRY